MKTQVIVAVFFAFVALSTADDPVKPTWPEEFDATFGLYVPATNTSDPIVNSTSHFYYKWTDLKASRIDYPEICLPLFYPGSQNIPCTLFFNPKGAYLYQPGIERCCLVFPGVGSVPPDFLAGFDYAGFDQIAIDYFGVPKFTHLWVAGGFQYWTDIATGEDVQFMDNGALNWNWGPLNVVSQPDSLFDVPDVCEQACKFGSDTASPQDVMPMLFVQP